MKDYASTKAITGKDWLNDLTQKATFYKLKEEGLAFCRKSKYKEAISSRGYPLDGIINANLDGFSSRNRSYIFRQIEAGWRRKCNIFGHGMDRLNSGTSYLKTLQDECLSIADSAIGRFSDNKTVSKNADKINDLYQGMAVQKVTQDISEGLELINKAVEIAPPFHRLFLHLIKIETVEKYNSLILNEVKDLINDR